MNDSHQYIKPREGTADLLKGLAVLFMIQVHVMEQFGTIEAYNSNIGKFSLFIGGPPCAPVFLAVMGYFLASSSKSITYFLKRGFLLFLGGILLNIGRSANLLLQIYSRSIQSDPLFFIFGADILTLAGISLVFIGLLRAILKKNDLLYFFAAITVVLLSAVIPVIKSSLHISPYILSFFGDAGNWSYFPVFPWFAYVLTGYAFYLSMQRQPVRQRMNSGNHNIYLIPVWIFLAITLPWAVTIAHNLQANGGYYHHNILFYGWVVLFLAVYVGMVNLVELNQGETLLFRIFKWFGRNVTLVYIIQWLIIGNLATKIYQTQNVFQVLLWFILVTLVTALISIGFLKIRFFYNKPKQE